MNAAVIFAGDHKDGLTARNMFLPVNNKPLIAWTLEALEHIEEIGLVEILCPENLEEEMAGLIEEYAILKAQVIVPPGESYEENFVHGILGVSDMVDYNDVILFMSAAMPMFDESIIKDAVNKAKQNHCALSDPKNDGITETDADSDLFNTLPQAYIYGELTDLYIKATQQDPYGGRENLPTTLMLINGKELFTSKGSKENIELKSPDDFPIFEAFIQKRFDEHFNK